MKIYGNNRNDITRSFVGLRRLSEEMLAIQSFTYSLFHKNVFLVSPKGIIKELKEVYIAEKCAL